MIRAPMIIESVAIFVMYAVYALYCIFVYVLSHSTNKDFWLGSKSSHSLRDYCSIFDQLLDNFMANRQWTRGC